MRPGGGKKKGMPRQKKDVQRPPNEWHLRAPKPMYSDHTTHIVSFEPVKWEEGAVQPSVDGSVFPAETAGFAEVDVQRDKPRKNAHAFVKESNADVKQAIRNVKSQQNGHIFGRGSTRSSEEDSQKVEPQKNGRTSPTKPGDTFNDDVPSAEPQQDESVTDAHSVASA